MVIELKNKTEELLATIRGYGPCAVAYSGGVDSAVVAKAAALVHGEQCLAITGSSHSLAQGELEQAAGTAAVIGIRHHVIHTDEFANPAYVRNAPDRCFHCKSELYSQLNSQIDQIAPELNLQTVLNGANVDDLGDYRPGLAAATNFNVKSPLADCGFTKSEVRQLAEFWSLPVWDKPATPCLSSRVAYGESVTPERLAMIDAGEQLLRSMGFPICRVRYHTGDLARIEVPAEQVAKLSQPEVCAQVTEQLTRLGFKFVTIDAAGFRSGSLNELLPSNLVTLDATRVGK